MTEEANLFSMLYFPKADAVFAQCQPVTSQDNVPFFFFFFASLLFPKIIYGKGARWRRAGRPGNTDRARDDLLSRLPPCVGGGEGRGKHPPWFSSTRHLAGELAWMKGARGALGQRSEHLGFVFCREPGQCHSTIPLIIPVPQCPPPS